MMSSTRVSSVTCRRRCKEPQRLIVNETFASHKALVHLRVRRGIADICAHDTAEVRTQVRPLLPLGWCIWFDECIQPCPGRVMGVYVRVTKNLVDELFIYIVGGMNMRYIIWTFMMQEHVLKLTLVVPCVTVSQGFPKNTLASDSTQEERIVNFSEWHVVRFSAWYGGSFKTWEGPRVNRIQWRLGRDWSMCLILGA